jgi:hypothetical protein
MRYGRGRKQYGTGGDGTEYQSKVSRLIAQVIGKG